MSHLSEFERALIEAGHRRYGGPRWRRWLFGAAPAVRLAAVTAFVAAIAVAAAISIGGADIERPAKDSLDTGQPNPPADERPREPVGVLRRPERLRDQVPDPLANGPLLNDGIAETDQARRVSGSKKNPSYLIPSQRAQGVCQVGNGALSCASREELKKRGFVPGFGTRGGVTEVRGVAADGLRHITITYAGGDTRTVNVKNNTVSVSSERRPLEINWLTPEGKRASVDLRDHWANIDFITEQLRERSSTPETSSPGRP